MERHKGAIALGILIVALFGWLKADISGLRTELAAGIRRLDQGQAALRERMAKVEVKMTRLEGLLEGIRNSILERSGRD